jgi:hypothetical protein
MKPRLLLLAVVAAAMLAAPAFASAATYCVGSPPGCVGIDKGTDLQAALNDALASSSTADQVQIGPAGSPYSRLDGFSYVGASSINPVEIMGVGSPTPTLTETTDGANSYQFVLQVQQGAASSVHDLNFTLPNQYNPAGLNMAGGTVQRVNVSNPLNYAGGTGVMVSGGTVEDSTFDLGTNGYGVDVRGGSTTPIQVQDNMITAATGFALTSSGAPVHLTRNRVSASYQGVQIYGGSADVDNTLFDLRGTGNWGIYATRYPSQANVDLDARQLTIRNGGGSARGVEEYTANTNSDIAVTLTDSIVRDVAHSVVQGTPPASSTFTFTADHDDYDQSTNLGTPDASTVFRTETNLVNVDPLFVNPISGANGITGDYRLSATSPVIDAGSATALGPGETDLASQPRIVDGVAPFAGAVRDLGAYEYQPAPPPTGSTPAPNLSVPPATRKRCKKKKHRAASAKKCKKKKQ